MLNYFKIFNTTSERRREEYLKIPLDEDYYDNFQSVDLSNVTAQRSTDNVIYNSDNDDDFDRTNNDSRLEDDRYLGMGFENKSLEQTLNDNYTFNNNYLESAAKTNDRNHDDNDTITMDNDKIKCKPLTAQTTTTTALPYSRNSVYKDTTTTNIINADANSVSKVDAKFIKASSFYDKYYNATDEANDLNNEYVYLSIVKKLLESDRRDTNGNALYGIPNDRWIRFDLKKFKIIFISTTLPATMTDRHFTEIALNYSHRILSHDSAAYIVRNCVKRFKKSSRNNEYVQFSTIIETTNNDQKLSDDGLVFTVIYEICGNADDETRTTRIYGIMERRQSLTDIRKSVPLDLLYGSVILQAIGHKLNTRVDYLFYTITGKFTLSLEAFNHYNCLLSQRPIRIDQCIEF